MTLSKNDSEYQEALFNGWKQVEKTVTFDGAAGSGAIGTVDLFTVTESVMVKIIGVCSTNLVGATATLEVGVTGSTAGLIAQTTATLVTANELLHDATPDSPIELSSVMVENIVGNGLDIFATVATANITAGVIKFICLWKPLTWNGNIISA